jgi:hypothetical protein
MGMKWGPFCIKFKKVIFKWIAEKYIPYLPANSQPAHVLMSEAT